MAGSDAARASPFVQECLKDLRSVLAPQPSALDVAMGTGRHSVALARAGFRVFGVDRDTTSVLQASARLSAAGQPSFLWVADLESSSLPEGRFHLVLCTRYLQRTLWPQIRQAVAPGGFVLYETFTVGQRSHDWGPRSSEHLLTPGELRAEFADWEVWHYEERDTPAAEASLLARKGHVRSPDPRLI